MVQLFKNLPLGIKLFFVYSLVVFIGIGISKLTYEPPTKEELIQQQKEIEAQKENERVKEIVRLQSEKENNQTPLSYYVEQTMKNPDSFDRVEIKNNIMYKGMLVDYLKYRGTNSFGAIVTEEVIGVRDGKGGYLSIKQLN